MAPLGFRAPSASDLVSQLAETLTTSLSDAATRRFTDPPLPEIPDSCESDMTNETTLAQTPSLHASAKAQMKQLVLDAVHEAMDDDLLWDELVGRLVTNPMRYSEPLDWEPVDEKSAKELVEQVIQGRGVLQRAPGVSLATSRVELTGGRGHVDRLFAAGQSWEMENNDCALGFFGRIERGQTIGNEAMLLASDGLKELLVNMLVEGVVVYLAHSQAV